MKKHSILNALLLCAFIPSCAILSRPDSGTAFIQASAADTATTAAVLDSGTGIEANPLGFAGVTVAKAGVYLVAKDMKPADKAQVFKTGTSATGGASVHNLFVWAGANPAVSVLAGLTSAIYLYFKPVTPPNQQVAEVQK